VAGATVTFKLDDVLTNTTELLGDRPPCPTGKRSFATKRAAQQAWPKIRADDAADRRTAMHPYRCGYCERFHLGHRRGAIL
jgi:hypothetical protein